MALSPVTKADWAWFNLCEDWQVARAAELAAFPTMGRAKSYEYVAALELYQARKIATQAVVARMLDFLHTEMAPEPCPGAARDPQGYRAQE